MRTSEVSSLSSGDTSVSVDRSMLLMVKAARETYYQLYFLRMRTRRMMENKASPRTRARKTKAVPYCMSLVYCFEGFGADTRCGRAGLTPGRRNPSMLEPPRSVRLA